VGGSVRGVRGQRIAVVQRPSLHFLPDWRPLGDPIESPRTTWKSDWIYGVRTPPRSCGAPYGAHPKLCRSTTCRPRIAAPGMRPPTSARFCRKAQNPITNKPVINSFTRDELPALRTTWGSSPGTPWRSDGRFTHYVNLVRERAVLPPVKGRGGPIVPSPPVVSAPPCPVHRARLAGRASFRCPSSGYQTHVVSVSALSHQHLIFLLYLYRLLFLPLHPSFLISSFCRSALFPGVLFTSLSLDLALCSLH